MTHQALIGQDTINPHALRSGIDLFREGAGESGAVWDARSSRIVSLYELMKPIGFSYFMELINQLVDTSSKYSYFEDDTKELGRRAFERFVKALERHEMVASVESAKKLLKFVDASLPDDPSTFNKLVLELRGRVTDEMKGREFFALSPHEALLYRSPTMKWEVIIERFPAALTDTEEAWKCFALSRYTAAVFHSLQIVEVGLIDLGEFIGVNDPMSGWTAVAQRLKKIIDTKYQDRSDFEKSNGAFLEQVQGTVEALKNAWRNKVSHVHGKLTLMTGEEFHPDVAEEILIATRAFMRRLAEGLPPTAEPKE